MHPPVHTKSVYAIRSDWHLLIDNSPSFHNKLLWIDHDKMRICAISFDVVPDLGTKGNSINLLHIVFGCSINNKFSVVWRWCWESAMRLHIHMCVCVDVSVCTLSINYIHRYIRHINAHIFIIFLAFFSLLPMPLNLIFYFHFFFHYGFVSFHLVHLFPTLF